MNLKITDNIKEVIVVSRKNYVDSGTKNALQAMFENNACVGQNTKFSCDL